MFDPERYRDLFPILHSKTHLANCSQGPLSVPVMDAIQEYEDSLIEFGMDWDRWMEKVREAKAAFASLIGASTDDIAVLSSVSDTVSAIASCLPIRGRTRVVTTVNEFPTVGHGWLAGAGRENVTFISSPDGFYTPQVVEPALGDETAILSMHFVAYYNGALQDVAELAKVAHQHDGLIFVDAYQGLGTVPLDVRESALDFVVCGNLKYLLGLPGIAFMYVRPGLSDELEPAMTGWFGRVNPFSFDPTQLDYAPGARRFDMGTPPVPAAYAAAAGMRLIGEIGVREIYRHVQGISQGVIDGALERGLEVASPLDVTRKGATTAIRVGERQSALIEQAMRRRGIIVAARADVIRIAPHFFTRASDVTTALDVLQEVLQELGVPAA
jgi:selenocysteine lyase/cysteine desulfurase